MNFKDVIEEFERTKGNAKFEDKAKFDSLKNRLKDDGFLEIIPNELIVEILFQMMDEGSEIQLFDVPIYFGGVLKKFVDDGLINEKKAEGIVEAAKDRFDLYVRDKIKGE